MMWNWVSKFIGKKEQSQRKRVQIDIPYEQHRYRKEDFDINEQAAGLEDNKTGN